MSAARPPNVLWIVADQLRYHALSCHGDPNVATPAIDALAASGVDCTEAVSQYPVCTPFRAALMTGQYPHVNGVTRHGDFLDPNARTVAHAFNDAGYRTSYVGKWHLAPESGAALVDPRGWAGQDFWVHPRLRGGFQDWFGFNISNNYYETYICSGDKVEPRRLEGHQTDALTDLSIEYLKGLRSGARTDGARSSGSGARHSGEPAKPWFHVISYEAPHPGRGGQPQSAGYPVPEPYESLYEPRSLKLRSNVPEEHELASRQQLAGYYRMIDHLDDNIGRLLNWLERSGQADDTLVVFLSDHGEMGGSHGLRNKQVPYEESLHIPLILRLPGRLPAGGRFERSICGVDIAATTLGLCGLGLLERAQGLDHAAALLGSDSPSRDSPSRDAPSRDAPSQDAASQDAPSRGAVLVQWDDTRFAFGDHPYRALRTPRFTYVVGRDDEFCILFDRRQDPFEMHNLYAESEQQGLRHDLHARLLGLLRDVGEAAPDYLLHAVEPREPAG